MKTGVALSLAFAGAACSDFLTGPGLTDDPNNPTLATAQQQLIAVQARMSTLLEGQIARNATIYTQQIIGANNQQLQYATQYGILEGDISGFFSAHYTGAGLVGLRNIQQYGTDNNDPVILGIAKIWEGLLFGNAISVWGDMPYSQANDPQYLTPILDPQQTLYGQVQLRLDEGIAALQGATATGNCEPSDLIYCATTITRALQVSRWIAAARTLKARYLLHLVERNGNASYTAAITQANSGILEAPTSVNNAMDGAGPGDFRTFHGNVIDVDANIWHEFLTARAGDIGAGNVLVSMLKTRSDPRLTRYFTSNNASGNFWGLNHNNQIVGAPAGEVASVVNIPVRRAATFRQPIVTWAENQMILAEAKFATGDPAGALIHVNNVRTSVGMAALPAVTSLAQVMEEKYIAQFQNIDVWNDYKRTCFPTLQRYQNAAEVPGRLPYGSAERTNNPNFPTPVAYPALTTGVSALRNWNDPNPCP